MTDSALSRLKPDEICVVVVDGIEHEAIWKPEKEIFQLRYQFGQIPADLVEEWWPASVKF